MVTEAALIPRISQADKLAIRSIISVRPVSTHLYRVYPKLGISVRSQLAAALSETPIVSALAPPSRPVIRGC